MSELDASPALQQVFNLRDLGGLPTTDGGRVRRGVLLRADSPHRASADDLVLLERLGLALLIDLRESSERDWFGVAAPSLARRHVHLPVFDLTQRSQDAFDDGMAAAARRRGRAGEYAYMFDHATGAFVEGLRLLAEPDHLPALFHCAVGKDRTGILAALTLHLVGVPDEGVAADYARSHDGMVALQAWAAQHEPRYGANLARGGPTDGEAWTTPEMILGFLDEVRGQHGSVRDALVAGGMAPDLPDRLRAVLVTS